MVGFIGGLILNLALSLWNFSRIQQAMIARDRGTNTLTRFIRDTASHAVFKNCYLTCIVSALGTLFGAVIFEKYIMVLTIIPTLAVAFYAFTQQKKSTESKQRIQDARQVTATTGEVVGNAAVVTCQIAGTATGLDTIVGADTCEKVGAGLGNAIKKATALEGTQQLGLLDKNDFNSDGFYKLDNANPALAVLRAKDNPAALLDQVPLQMPSRQPIQSLPNSGVTATPNSVPAKALEDRTAKAVHQSYSFNIESFRESAKAYGIDIEGKTDDEIANHLLKYAPSALLNQLDPNLSNVEKADRIMKGSL